MIKAHTRPKGFKKSRLAIFTEIAKRKNRPNKFLEDRPDCPFEMLYLWSLYNALLKGSDNILWSDIRAYEDVSGVKLTPFEANLMIDIDLIRRNQSD